MSCARGPLGELSGRSSDATVRLPGLLFAGMSRLGAVAMRLAREKSGLDLSHLHEVLLTEADIDLTTSQSLLAYGQSDVRQALAATVDSVPDYRSAAGWLRSLESGRFELI